MKNILNDLIDSTIRQHATKRGYDYSLQCVDLHPSVFKELVDIFLQDDINFKDVVRDYLDDYIDARLKIVGREDAAGHGLIPMVDSINGEISFRQRYA